MYVNITSNLQYVGMDLVYKYTITYYVEGQLGAVYSYSVNSVSYNGVYVPSFSEIQSSAYKKIPNVSPCKINISSGINCNYDDYRLTDISNIKVDGFNLGSFVRTELVEVLDIPVCALCSETSPMYTYNHIFEHGYIREVSHRFRSYVFLHDEIFEYGGSDPSGSSLYNFPCGTLSVSFFSTDSRIETDCCVLVCCEPTKYKLKN